MTSILQRWLTGPAVFTGDEAKSTLEHMTRVILSIMGALLLIFTAMIAATWLAGLFDFFPVAVMLILDAPVLLGWQLTKRGRGNIARYIPPILFLGLAIYLNYSAGTYSTGILFYLIAIILTSVLFNIRSQWFMLALCSICYVTIGIAFYPEPRDLLISAIITTHAAFIGTTFLQWFFTDQLKSALSRSEANAAELARQKAELSQINAELRHAIDARASAQEALSETERMLTTLMANLPGMVYRCKNDRDFTMEFVSDGCLELTGYRPGDLIENQGTSFMEIIHPEDRERVWTDIQLALKNKKPFQLTYRIQTRNGRVRWVWEQGRGVFSPDGQLATLEGFISDVTDRIAAETALRKYADRLEILHQIEQSILAAQSPRDIAQAALTRVRTLIPCQRATVSLFDFEAQTLHVLAADLENKSGLESGMVVDLSDYLLLEELQHLEPSRIADLEKDVRYTGANRRILLEEGIRSVLAVPLISQKQLIGALNLGSLEKAAFSAEHIEIARELGNSLAIALQNARLNQETKQQAQMLASIYKTSLTTGSILETEELMEQLYHQVQGLFSPDAFLVAFYDDAADTIEVTFVREAGQDLPDWNKQRFPASEGGLAGWVAQNRQTLLIGNTLSDPLPTEPIHGQNPARSWLGVPMITRGRVIGALSLQSFDTNAFDEGHANFMEALAAQIAISLENARLFEETHRRAQDLATLVEVSAELRNALTLEEMLPDLLEKSAASLEASFSNLYLVERSSKELVAYGWYPPTPDLVGLRAALDEGIPGRVAQSGEIYIYQDIARDPYATPYPPEARAASQVKSGIAIPLRAHEMTIGVFQLGWPERRSFSAEETGMATAIADMAANAIRRAVLFEETQRRFEHLVALRKIDRAITASLDLRPILDVLLDQLTSLLEVDAATVLLLSPHTQTLNFAARRGFHTGALRHTHLSLGEGYAGQAALQHEIIHIPDLYQSEGEFSRASLLAQEGFNSYIAVPLIAKGQVKGVLEIFHRRQFKPDREWMDFMDALATQAAIAIDNAELFEGLQKANTELVKAYDSTIEGWSHALDLHSEAVEGHSNRVTELTLRLARAMGMTDQELPHVRRGALLHDIGMMGVPDQILLKPDRLTAEEWEIMKQHPVFAYELLSPIAYLHRALDIPYSHHERWDGSGYPLGLEGEQIPLAARIFAVVDSYDALRSERPYRPAWSEEKTLEYIREKAGSHFDPRVVEVFLDLIARDKYHRLKSSP